MTAEADVDEAADRLWHAWRTGVPCQPVRSLIGERDIDAAYAVQRRNERRVVAHGDRVVGRKVGLTSVAVQRQLGVDQPDFGPLFASRQVSDGGVIDVAPLIAPRIEAEVALVLGSALDDPDMTLSDVRRATRAVMAAMEVVDSRVKNWDVHISDTIADFASGAAFVLGSEAQPLGDMDLSSVPMVMWRDGEEVCRGSGAASLGDPVKAALWLARTLIARGTPLGEGDVVLTGALGPFVGIASGQQVRADFGPLGSVSLSVERSEG